MDGRAPRTVNRHLTHVRGFFNWCVKLGELHQNPLAGIARRPEHEKRRKRRPLTEDKIARLLEAARRPEAHSGEYIAYTLAVYTGLRQNEIRTLRWSDLNLETNILVVRAENEKARRGATLPMHPALVRVLLESLADHPALPSARVVELPDHPALKLQKTLAAAGIPYKDDEDRYADFHALRHTCLTMLARSGCDLKTLQTLARHSTLELTLRIYVHRDREREAAAVSTLPDFTGCGGDRKMAVEGAQNTVTD